MNLNTQPSMISLIKIEQLILLCTGRTIIQCKNVTLALVTAFGHTLRKRSSGIDTIETLLDTLMKLIKSFSAFPLICSTFY